MPLEDRIIYEIGTTIAQFVANRRVAHGKSMFDWQDNPMNMRPILHSVNRCQPPPDLFFCFWFTAGCFLPCFTGEI